MQMSPVYGWWYLEEPELVLVNSVTGERIRYHGSIDDEHRDSSHSFIRFTYEHVDLHYPIVVRVTRRKRSASQDTDPAFEVWHIDHLQSAQCWKAESKASTAAPPYGIWRRVDDAATDAFACWPDGTAAGAPLWPVVFIDGGWHNGRWTGGIFRSFNRVDEEMRRRSSSLEHQKVDAEVFPLDASAPSPWHFEPADVVAGSQAGSSHEVQNNVHPDYVNLKWNQYEGVTGEPEWAVDRAIGVALGGPHNGMPYLGTKDGLGLMYPYWGDTKKNTLAAHTGGYGFELVCIDSETACGLRAIPHSHMQAFHWNVSILQPQIGCRDVTSEAMFVRRTSEGARIPTRRLALKLHWAVIDGWLQWRGTAARCKDWLPSLTLGTADSVAFSYNYRGGMASRGFSCFAQTRPILEQEGINNGNT